MPDYAIHFKWIKQDKVEQEITQMNGYCELRDWPSRCEVLADIAYKCIFAILFSQVRLSTQMYASIAKCL